MAQRFTKNVRFDNTYASAEEFFEIRHQSAWEPRCSWSLDLYQKIYITFGGIVSTGNRAEHTDSGYAMLTGNAQYLFPFLPQYFAGSHIPSTDYSTDFYFFELRLFLRNLPFRNRSRKSGGNRGHNTSYSEWQLFRNSSQSTFGRTRKFAHTGIGRTHGFAPTIKRCARRRRKGVRRGFLWRSRSQCASSVREPC